MLPSMWYIYSKAHDLWALHTKTVNRLICVWRISLFEEAQAKLTEYGKHVKFILLLLFVFIKKMFEILFAYFGSFW